MERFRQRGGFTLMSTKRVVHLLFFVITTESKRFYGGPKSKKAKSSIEYYLLPNILLPTANLIVQFRYLKSAKLILKVKMDFPMLYNVNSFPSMDVNIKSYQ